MLDKLEKLKIKIRPRPNTYAIMFEKNGQRFWFHLDDYEIKLMKEIEVKE